MLSIALYIENVAHCSNKNFSEQTLSVTVYGYKKIVSILKLGSLEGLGFKTWQGKNYLSDFKGE